MTDLIKKRNKYYRMIWEYENRRRELRVKFGFNPDSIPTRAATKEYMVTSAKYTNKIRQWGRQMRRIDARKARIVFLENSVRKFMGFGIQGNARNNPQLMIAKCIYYKCGLENGMAGLDLIQNLGDKCKNNASRGRIRLTQSFTTTPENKEIWLRFKAYHQRRLDYEERRVIKKAPSLKGAS